MSAVEFKYSNKFWDLFKKNRITVAELEAFINAKKANPLELFGKRDYQYKGMVHWVQQKQVTHCYGRTCILSIVWAEKIQLQCSYTVSQTMKILALAIHQSKQNNKPLLNNLELWNFNVTIMLHHS